MTGTDDTGQGSAEALQQLPETLAAIKRELKQSFSNRVKLKFVLEYVEKNRNFFGWLGGIQLYLVGMIYQATLLRSFGVNVFHWYAWSDFFLAAFHEPSVAILVVWVDFLAVFSLLAATVSESSATPPAGDPQDVASNIRIRELEEESGPDKRLLSERSTTGRITQVIYLTLVTLFIFLLVAYLLQIDALSMQRDTNVWNSVTYLLGLSFVLAVLFTMLPRAAQSTQLMIVLLVTVAAPFGLAIWKAWRIPEEKTVNVIVDDIEQTKYFRGAIKISTTSQYGFFLCPRPGFKSAVEKDNFDKDATVLPLGKIVFLSPRWVPVQASDTISINIPADPDDEPADPVPDPQTAPDDGAKRIEGGLHRIAKAIESMEPAEPADVEVTVDRQPLEVSSNVTLELDEEFIDSIKLIAEKPSPKLDLGPLVEAISSLKSQTQKLSLAPAVLEALTKMEVAIREGQKGHSHDELLLRVIEAISELKCDCERSDSCDCGRLPKLDLANVLPTDVRGRVGARYYAWARDEFFQADLSKAIKYLDLAIQCVPSDARCYFYRGLAKHRMGQQESAVADIVIGATLEKQKGGTAPRSIGMELARIQGAERLWVEEIRTNPGHFDQ